MQYKKHSILPYRPEIDGFSNIADVIANLSKKKLVNSFVRDALMFCFHLYGRYFINLRLTITRYINKKSEQGSSFLMNKKNIKYIVSLMN